MISQENLTSFDAISNAVEIHSSRCKDIIVNDPDISVKCEDGRMVLEAKGHKGSFLVTDHAKNQLCGVCDIKQTTLANLTGLKEDIALEGLVNRQIKVNRPQRRHMLRLYQDEVRSVVTPGYPRLDVKQAWATIQQASTRLGLHPKSAIINRDEFRFALTAEATQDIKQVGSPVEFGLNLGGSEVGQGSLTLSMQLMILICLNGCTFNQGLFSFSRVHRAGACYDFGELSSPTRDDNPGIWEAFEKASREILVPGKQEQIMDTINTVSERRIEGNLSSGLITYQKMFNLSQEETLQVYSRMTGSNSREYPKTQLGVWNAVTNIANTARTPIRGAALEAIGGQTLFMTDSKWKGIAHAKPLAAKDDFLLH